MAPQTPSSDSFVSRRTLPRSEPRNCFTAHGSAHGALACSQFACDGWKWRKNLAWSGFVNTKADFRVADSLLKEALIGLAFKGPLLS